jgi:hypothetical protein
MHEYYSIHKIFLDIHEFITGFIKLSKTIHENPNELHPNILTIQLDKGSFLLPATFNNFSQRADELQTRLQTQIRILAQKRRNDILKGIDSDADNQIQSYQFDNDLQIHVKHNKSDQIIRYIQSILTAFDLYNEIQATKHSTFHVLPIVKHIQKQVENSVSFSSSIYFLSYVVFQ